MKPTSNETPIAPVLFAGGGTGGHIFPGIAVAEAVHSVSPTTRIRFACSERAIDAKILAKQTLGGVPVEFQPNPGKPFGLRPKALLAFIMHWGAAVRHGRGLIQSLRTQSSGRTPVVVAMGGFVAAPLVQAARAEKCPILMMNLDSVPGRANRWIARHASSILTTAVVPNADWRRVPPLVRSAAVWSGSPAEARASLGLNPDQPTLFITGASQGARSINRFIIELVKQSPALFSGWQIIHQTGPSETAEAKAAYEAAGLRNIVAEFIDAMGPCWAAADFAIARAGAGSVAEAWAMRVPAVFLPYPYHADQHQRANAAELVTCGGAITVQDHIDPARNISGDAGEAVRRLLASPNDRAAMRQGLVALGPVDGAAQVSAEIRRLGDQPALTRQHHAPQG